ncbi:tumor necrosis factor receptor superfamily member 10D-like isoform X2 [Tenrec ecaudatus]|uniref:tumor necrosis factor receptor superfamily member 10D-like isoform X2 n=1 Tax=Tenrec ecaudatus TaxID=94439 RepID=UPI003F5A4F2F
MCTVRQRGGTRAGHTPGSWSWWEAGLPGLWMFPFVALSVLPLVLADSVSRNLEERIPSKTTAPQQSLEQMCPPGSYLSEVTRRCTPCRLGVTYTSYSNSLPYCLICSECKPDYEEETHTCTLTRDKICGCKAGTFYKDDSPEFCRKCSPRCPEGMVEDSPCTPNSDRKCIPRKAGTKATEKARAYEEPVPTGLGTPTTASPLPSGIEPWKIGMIVLGVIGLLLALGCWCVPRCWRGLQGHEQSEQGHKQTLAVCLRHLGNCAQCRGPEQQAADQLDPEQRMEGQEQDRMAGACVQIPVEGEPLLENR